MADSPTQDGRIGKLATPLGKDKLCLTRFEGTEAIGELFEYRIEAVSPDPNLDFNDALGKTCSVHLDTTDRVGRDFSGILTEAKWVGTRFNLPLYRLVLRPWPWILSLTVPLPDLCKYERQGHHQGGSWHQQLWSDRGPYGRGLPDAGIHGPISRDVAQFRFADDGEVWDLLLLQIRQGRRRLAQSTLSGPRQFATTTKPYRRRVRSSMSPPSAAGPDDTQLFNDWSRQQAVIAGIFELNDYDYNKPNAELSTHEAYFTPPARSLVYDYPGGYDDKTLGDRLTKVRQEAERVFEDHCAAGGYAPSLTPGYSIQRKSQNGDSQDNDYLILRCNHWYGDQSYASAGGSGSPGGESYSGSYELSRVAIPYRMPLRTRRPVIIGSQPAKVISKENQEIDVDKQGRVLVEFYWDDTTGSNAPKKTPSRRVRVGQFWAGLRSGRAVHSPCRRRSDGRI